MAVLLWTLKYLTLDLNHENIFLYWIKICCVKSDNNIVITQCFKAQSILLGRWSNVAETKAVMTGSHL